MQSAQIEQIWSHYG